MKNDDQAWSAAKDIIEVADGYIITGASVDTIEYWWRRIPILKIDYQGNIIWKKDYGDTIADYYTGWPGSLIKVNDSIFYISGSKNIWNSNNYDIGYISKFNSEFDTLWSKSFDLNIDNIYDTSILLNQIKFCSNKDLIFGGGLNDNAVGSMYLLLCTDSSGNLNWYRTYSLGGTSLSQGYSVIQTSDSGFAIGGYSYTPGYSITGDPIVIKTDSLGNLQWMTSVGGPVKDNKAMLCLSHDKYIIAGTNYGDSMSGNTDSYSRISITKLDLEGNVIWDNKYGPSKKYNYLLNIKCLSDSTIIAVGTMPSIFPHYIGWLLKVDSNGDSIWYREYDLLKGLHSRHTLYNVIETSDGGFIACGDVWPGQDPDTGNMAAWVIKLDSIGCDTAGCDPTVGIVEEDENTRIREGERVVIWPNPARDVIHVRMDAWTHVPFPRDVTITIYDIYGRAISSSRLHPFPPSKEITIDVSGYPPGLYIAVIRNNKQVISTAKFVISR